MKKKQILAIIMIVGVLCSFMSINVSARSSMEITPYRWSNISVVVCTVGFQGTTGTVLCNIIGKAGATAVRGTLVLYEGATEKKSWDLASSTGSVYVLEGFTGIS